MDRISREDRSALMAKIKSADTGPEVLLRKELHRSGYRYRLHYRALPGRPDIVFPARKKVLFVHGCFWHGHNCMAGRNRPASNTDYWEPKLTRNVERDRTVRMQLRQLGWESKVIWECEINNHLDVARKRAARFLDRNSRSK